MQGQGRAFRAGPLPTAPLPEPAEPALEWSLFLTGRFRPNPGCGSVRIGGDLQAVSRWLIMRASRVLMQRACPVASAAQDLTHARLLEVYVIGIRHAGGLMSLRSPADDPNRQMTRKDRKVTI